MDPSLQSVLRDSELEEYTELLGPTGNSDVWLAINQTHSDETLLVELPPDSPQNVEYNNVVPFKPVTHRGPPERNDFPGNCNFSIAVNSANCQKKKFLYSHKLNRIYVDVNCNFSLTFNWDHTKTPSEMFVRSTVVFSEAEQWEKRVERCLQHFHESSEFLAKEVAKNVLHSSREFGTAGLYYCGDADVPDSWYSVVVHNKKINAEPCTHAYKFTCKSSCPSGINRRPISIIFTLEDSIGEVYGRQTVGVRVCSCLKRDMRKDEESEGVFQPGKKRIASHQIPQPKTKKIKQEARDNEHVMAMLPSIPVEVNAMISGLRTMVDGMTIAGLHDPSVVQTYKESIIEIKTAISNLEKGILPQ